LHGFGEFAEPFPENRDRNGDQWKNHDREQRVLAPPNKNPGDIKKDDKGLFHKIHDHIRDGALDLPNIIHNPGKKISGPAPGIKIMRQINKMPVKIIPDLPNGSNPDIGHLVVG